MLRVNLKVIGLNEEPVDTWVDSVSARVWLDMLGKRVKIGDNYLFIREARTTMNPLTYELNSITVTVSRVV